LVSSYQYDANGLRIRKVEGATETRFVIDGQSALAEYDSANVAARHYLQNEEAVDDIYAFAEGGQNYFPLTDALGSVVSITDSSGAVVRRNNYELYGTRTSTGTGPDLAFGFTGREQDASGWGYHRDRYSNTATATWSQPDRSRFADGPNWFQITRNNPVSLVDPDGRGSVRSLSRTAEFSDAILQLIWGTRIGMLLQETISSSNVDYVIEETDARSAPGRGGSNGHYPATTGRDADTLNYHESLEGCSSGQYWIKSVISTASVAYWNNGRWEVPHTIGEVAAHEMGHVAGFVAWGFGFYLRAGEKKKQEIIRFSDISACFAGRSYRQQTGETPLDADKLNPDECKAAMADGMIW
jgi:RHS repeat-associated protein